MSKLIFSNRFSTASYYGGMIQGEEALETRLLGAVAIITASDDGKTDYTLEEAWDSKTGAVLLLGSPASNPAELARQALDRLVKPGVRLVWIANPDADPTRWNSAVFATDGPDVLDAPVEMHLDGEERGFGLHFAKAVAISRDGPAGLTFTGGPMRFGRGGTMLPVEGDHLALKLDAVTGPAMDFGFAIPRGEKLVETLDGLDLGFWYTRRSGSAPRAAYRYPIFQSHARHDGWDCTARLTPSRLLDRQVTRITADPASDSRSNYVTWFRSLLGRSLIVAAKTPMTMFFNATTKAGLGLSLAGSFTLRFSDQASTRGADIGVEDAVDELRFACGTAGTECITVPKAEKDALSLDLVAGQPAAAVVAGDEIGLTAATTTSWVRISSPNGLSYEAQPAGQGTLYNATAATQTPVPILPYMPPIALPILAGDDAQVLPMVPVAGLKKDGDRAPIDLEATAIAPARKGRLTAIEEQRQAGGMVPNPLPMGLAVEAGEHITGITPSGLEAVFDDSGWVSVQIARLLGLRDGNSGQLRFAGPAGIVDPLKSALLTSQQFLVISDPQAIKDFFQDQPGGDGAPGTSNTQVALRRWIFEMAPKYWAEHGTILIVKNTQVAMQSLLDDTSAWTSAEKFNTDIPGTSRRLQEIAADARANRKENRATYAAMTGDADDPSDAFDFFVDTVLDSPGWNGFLFLNARLDKFPEELAGMRAGIDPAGLYAHHLGVTQTPFTSLEDLAKRSSSMFGLIRYADTKPLTAEGLNYQFRVRQLYVLFADSDIRDFRTTLDLAIGSLFGQRSRPSKGTSAISEMVGTRHLRGAGDTYSFTSINDVEFELGNGPLRKVALLQGEFVTKSIAPADEPEGWIRNVFRFSGWMGFAAVKSGDEEYDVFSFEQLAFSDLLVSMDFRRDRPEQPVYTFSIDELELSEALSVARRSSLFEGFPIKLDALVHGSGNPESQGNMTVQLPDVQSGLPSDWYGLRQTIDMGTLSDVAGAAGLEANLLTAWGSNEGQYYVGLNISGPRLSGLGTEISLLSVLKLKAYALSLRHDEDAWTLLMSGMTLSIFSKTLPPGGAFEFYIFGVPDPTGSANSLGWYGAWVAEKEDGSGEQEVRVRALDNGVEELPLLTQSLRRRFRPPEAPRGEVE
jgi:hypothetical protein